MLPAADRYDDLLSRFAWDVPARYNIGVDVCDKWADGSGRLALIHETAQGDVFRITFDDLRNASNRLANSFVRAGLRRGDRIGIFLAQGPETAVAHLAAYKLGAIAVPLFTLFGVDALEYRLANSEAAALVTDAAGYAKIAPLRARLPALHTVYCIGDDAPDQPGVLRYDAALAAETPDFVPADTAADDPAVIIYTSGTTGKPKGALHAHRVLLGHLPGVEMSQQCFPRDARLFWTPADWAWIGGLLDVLLPSWHHGVPVLARRFEKFDGDAAFALMARHGVRNAFLPPTALKMMRNVPNAVQYGAHPRSIGSGGETLGTELLDWGRATFGVTINEFYGQTECNMIVSACSPLFETPPGSIGKPALGHQVAVIGDDGQVLPPGELGHIAVRSPDPVMFLRYWNNPQATTEKFIGEYLVTGDSGVMDEDGFVRFRHQGDARRYAERFGLAAPLMSPPVASTA